MQTAIIVSQLEVSLNSYSLPLRAAYRETSPRKKQPLQRGRSNSVDRQRMTSPGRLYSSGRQTSREGLGNRNQGLEGLEVREHQIKQLQQQCATAANKCRELQEALREKDGEVRFDFSCRCQSLI